MDRNLPPESFSRNTNLTITLTTISTRSSHTNVILQVYGGEHACSALCIKEHSVVIVEAYQNSKNQGPTSWGINRRPARIAKKNNPSTDNTIHIIM